MLVTEGQLAVVVVDEICTDKELPAARSTPLAPPQLKVPALIAQVVGLPQPADGNGAVIVNVPVLVGSESDILTPCAVPGPLLVTVIVNPIPSPADTSVGESAVLVIANTGQSTVTVAGELTGLPSLLEKA